MRQVEAELDRYLSLLRRVIRRQGYTQLEIQEILGWGRSYISQLVTRQKSLRVEHVLLILKVVEVDPKDFFSELYVRQEAPGVAAGPAPAAAEPRQVDGLLREIEEQRKLLQVLVELLVEKRVIDGGELMTAVQRESSGDA